MRRAGRTFFPWRGVRSSQDVARLSSIGLCEICRHVRTVPGRQSTFILCTRALSDPSFAKYPVLPVVTCPGYDPSTPPRPGEPS